MRPIMWNYSCLWAPMFVAGQKFAGSWECNFVTGWLDCCITVQDVQLINLLNFHGDVNSWLRVTRGIHKHWSLTKNNDSNLKYVRFSPQTKIIKPWNACQFCRFQTLNNLGKNSIQIFYYQPKREGRVYN